MFKLLLKGDVFYFNLIFSIDIFSTLFLFIYLLNKYFIYLNIIKKIDMVI